MQNEGAEGKTESNVVDGVRLRSGGKLSVGDGNLDWLGHYVVLSWMHLT